jgi:hypothetical protein
VEILVKPSEHSPVAAETTKQVTFGHPAALQNWPMSSRVGRSDWREARLESLGEDPVGDRLCAAARKVLENPETIYHPACTITSEVRLFEVRPKVGMHYLPS